MPWSGSWNGSTYTGTYTAADGTVFNGTWTMPPASPDPSGNPPSNYNPLNLGPAPDDSRRLTRPWDGTWSNGVFTGTCTFPDGTAFSGTMTPPRR